MWQKSRHLLRILFLRSQSNFSNEMSEKTLVNNYFNYIQRKNQKNTDSNAEQYLHDIQYNINKFQNLESIIGIVDKSFKNNITISAKLMDELLNHADILIRQNRIQDIEKIKGILLVLQLNKLEKRSLYESIINYVNSNLSLFPLEHLITISESLIYNKLFVRYHGIKIFDLLCFLTEKFSLESEKNLSNISDIIRKINSIIVFLEKGSFQFYTDVERSKVSPLLYQTQMVYMILLQNMKNQKNQQENLHGLFSSKSSQQFDFNDEQFKQIFDLVEIQDSFDQLAKILNIKNQIYKDFFLTYKKSQMTIDTFLNQKLKDDNIQKILFSQKKIEIMSNFLKKFLLVPPHYFPKQMKSMINNVYYTILHEFIDSKYIKCDYNIQILLPFLVFLLKDNNSPIKLDHNNLLFLDFLCDTESNIYNLARLLEGLGQLYYKSKRQNIQELTNLVKNLENKIVNLSRNTISPLTPLLQLFQSIVQLYPYEASQDTINYLFDFFLYGKNLQRMNWVELTIKFLPSLGIFTKNINSKYNNNQIMDDSNIKKLKELWERITILLFQRVDNIQIDKIPIILIYLSHSSYLSCINTPTLIINLRRIIENNLNKYSGIQLSEILFSYSRLNYNETQFYINIAKHIIENNIKLPVEATIGILWALAISKIKIEHFIQYLEQIILKDNTNDIPLDLITQYFQANSIQNRQPNQQILQNFINLANKKYQQKIENYKNYFLINCGLIINDSEIDVSQNLLQCISDNKEAIMKNPLQAHQLYLLYLINQTKPYPNPYISMLPQFIPIENILKYSKQFKEISTSAVEIIIIEKIKYLLSENKIQLKNIKQSKYIFANEILDEKIELENFIPFQSDFRVHNYCFEVNGPRHYISSINNEYQIIKFELDRPTQLKKKVLESMGFIYIEINLRDLGSISSLKSGSIKSEKDDQKLESELIIIIEKQLQLFC